MPNHRGTPEQFWNKVTKTASCWLWAGKKDGKGYGVVFRTATGSASGVRAHRYAWEISNGSIPDGMYVCHHCDVKDCVRPSHLFLGTQLDNMRDCWTKGRVAHGDRLPQTKLTKKQVSEIRELASRGITQEMIAAQFGILSRAHVSRIISRKSWKHV